VLVRVAACGVCRTELDQVEGRLAPRGLPVVPGHQVVGEVVARGSRARQFKDGDLIGVTWIFSSCGRCEFCMSERENLCMEFRATGCDADGGYAEYMTVPQAFAVTIPRLDLSPTQIAPLLCAGVIGYRAVRLAHIEDGMAVGLSGFGSSNSLVFQIVRSAFPSSRIYVWSRNLNERNLALQLGAAWAGPFAEAPPVELQRIIDATPTWRPVLVALASLARGGRLIINAISKSAEDQDALQELDYSRHLWLEKEVKSAANVTRQDALDLLALAARAGIAPVVETYPLDRANAALDDIRNSRRRGSKVLYLTRLASRAG
jgi:propanol-preferring alcohol dehydrogenase